MSSIEKGWYNGSLVNYLLAPLSLLFFVISVVRRSAFKLRLLKSFQAKRPVIIVGNISVGGNGKTPFVIKLVELLQQQDLKVGVISRGYGGKSEVYPVAVDESLDTSVFGDEPVLIHKRTGCTVVVGSDRIKSCDMLVEDYGCDIIVSDDGMQHYRLQRDMEIAIVDAKRQFGNGWVMPVGPLRELASRLDSVDYVIYNGVPEGDKAKGVDFEEIVAYEIKPGIPASVLNDNLIPGYQFNGEGAHVICGIGNPQRFEQTVQDLNIHIKSFHGFADHYHYTKEDFAAFGDSPVLMTEKDAVKCQSFARPNWWYIPIDAQLPDAFEKKLINSIKKVIDSHGI